MNLTLRKPQRLSFSKKIIITLFAILPLLVFSYKKSIAQQQSQTLLEVSYIKLNAPANAAEYELLVNGHTKALKTASLKNGQIQGWYTWKVIMPSGKASEYDYISIITTRNLEAALDNSVFTAGQNANADSAKQITAQLNSISTVVKKEVYAVLSGAGTIQTAAYANINYIKPTSIKSEMITWEKENKKKSQKGEILSTQLAEKQFPHEVDALYDIISITTFNDLKKIDIPKKTVSTTYFTVNKSVIDQPLIDPTTLVMNTQRKVIKGDVLKLVTYIDNNPSEALSGSGK